MIQPKDIVGYYYHFLKRHAELDCHLECVKEDIIKTVKYVEDNPDEIDLEFVIPDLINKKLYYRHRQRELLHYYANYTYAPKLMKIYRKIDLEELCKEAFKPSRVEYIINNYGMDYL